VEITKEMLVKAGLDASRIDDPDFIRVLGDALGIQERFAAEPVYARTGKGYLKSVGVKDVHIAKRTEAAAIKKNGENK